MEANPEQYHVALSANNELPLKKLYFSISDGRCEKLLGIKIDHELPFEAHVKSVCKKASQKLNALSQFSFLRFE